jgi:hypothetical protein
MKSLASGAQKQQSVHNEAAKPPPAAAAKQGGYFEFAAQRLSRKEQDKLQVKSKVFHARPEGSPDRRLFRS